MIHAMQKIEFRPGVDPSTMTVDQLLADEYELTLHLLNRFGKCKLVVMGHFDGCDSRHTSMGLYDRVRALLYRSFTLQCRFLFLQ